MAIQGRTVRLFLVDGSPTGLLTAEILNWTGHVFVAPRSRLVDALKREEISRTGVYFLIGNDLDQPSRNRVYVGEADDVSDRIKKHAKDTTKDFWSSVCIVTSKDQNLTKAHVRFLECRLIEMAKEADRANLDNGNSPGSKLLPESDVADMEYFLSQMQIVLPVVGFDFLRPKPTLFADAIGNVDPKLVTDQIQLILTSRKHKINARAIEKDGEFTVLCGSTASAKSDFVSNNYQSMRNSLISDGSLIKTGDHDVLQFSENVIFPSPSAAAAVIFNRNANGRTSWKVVSTGQTLRDYQNAQLNLDQTGIVTDNTHYEQDDFED